MNALSSLLDPIRSLDLERLGPFRPSYPPVAVEVERREIVLVRLTGRGRGRPRLEASEVRQIPEHMVGGSLFRPNMSSPEEAVQRVRELFEASGTKPGRVSLILPDNFAKVSLIALPERPPSRKQLLEVLRFKLRRSIPFRLEDAILSHQVISGEGGGVNVLVAVVPRAVVEQYERVLESAGARPGLVDLCTPCVFNLCRPEITKVAQGDRDVALLNCARSYFSLVIVRGERLIFYRCKSYPASEEESMENGVMAREVISSISYYQEKLSGRGLEAAFVRTVAQPMDEVTAMLGRIGIDRVHPVDPAGVLSMGEGVRLDPEVGQRIAPAVGAAAGRGH